MLHEVKPSDAHFINIFLVYGEKKRLKFVSTPLFYY